MMLHPATDLESINTDWGEGADDNTGDANDRSMGTSHGPDAERH